jgi:hypothetical protein
MNRTVDRFAFYFGIAHAILGGLSLFSPFVRPSRRSGIARVLPARKQHGIINKRSGQLMGMMGAVNPPHAVLHTVMGVAGIAASQLGRFTRPYMWANGALMSLMAVMGWKSFGFHPGDHKVMGIALDRKENIIHTLWGAASLFLAARPLAGENMVEREVHQTMAEVGVPAD